MNDVPRSTGGSREGEFRAHPLVAKLIEAIEGDEGVVELQGFIGPWPSEGDDSVPLYTTLELTERILVPRDAIVHVEEPEGDQMNEEPTRVYVKGSAELRLISCSVTTIRADEVSPTWSTFTKKTIKKLPPHMLRAAISGGGGGFGSPCSDGLTSCLQRAGGDYLRQIGCFGSYLECKKEFPWA